MFGKRRTIINGVELSEEFSGSSIVNNVAISSDGKKYAAVTKSGGIVTGEIPTDGRIEIDGAVITYKKSFFGQRVNISGSRVQMSSISGGSIVMSGGGCSVSIGCSGSNLEYEIDRGYDSVNKVTLTESANNVHLGLSNDEKVYVQGNTSAEPTYKNGRLFVDGLEGKLSVPKSNPCLELDIKTSAGDVDGKVSHTGRIRTSAGDITLELYAPVTLETSTSAGDVHVKGMISEGRGVYNPPNANPLGTLVLETSAGDITVDYKNN